MGAPRRSAPLLCQKYTTGDAICQSLNCILGVQPNSVSLGRLRAVIFHSAKTAVPISGKSPPKILRKIIDTALKSEYNAPSKQGCLLNLGGSPRPVSVPFSFFEANTTASLRTSPQAGVAIPRFVYLLQRSGRLPRQCAHCLAMTARKETDICYTPKRMFTPMWSRRM